MILIRVLLSFLLVMVAAASLVPSNSEHSVQKKSFSSIGCLGSFDRSKFARLDRICEECYQLYRDTEIHNSCREFCFKNDVFPACVDALLLSHEQKELNDIVDELLG